MDNNKIFWERFAFLYTPLMKSNDKMYAQIIEKCTNYLNKDMKALEIACGTGQLTFKLADKVKTVTATDFSEKMIKRAKKRNCKENINFSVQDATNLPYKENTFDTVVIANALHIMPKPEKALQNIYRVLNNSGILIAPTFIYEETTENKHVSFMEKFGFKTYFKWNSDQLSKFVEKKGFKTIHKEIVKASPCDECILIFKKT